MDTRVLCAYNLARGVFLSLKVTVADNAHQPLTILKVLVGGLAIDAESGLWLNPVQGIPAVPRLFPFDLLYLDKNSCIIEQAEFIPGMDLPPYRPEVASALLIAPRSLHSSQTERGDRLLIGLKDEVEGQIAASSAGPPRAASPHTPRNGRSDHTGTPRSERTPRAASNSRLAVKAGPATATAVAEDVSGIPVSAEQPAARVEDALQTVAAPTPGDVGLTLAPDFGVDVAPPAPPFDANQPLGEEGAPVDEIELERLVAAPPVSPVAEIPLSAKPAASQDLPGPSAAIAPHAANPDIPEAKDGRGLKPPVMSIKEVLVESSRTSESPTAWEHNREVEDLFSNWMEAPSLAANWKARGGERLRQEVESPITPSVAETDAPAAPPTMAAAPVAAGPLEAMPAEAGPAETMPVEAGPVEAGPVEAGPVEAGPQAAVVSAAATDSTTVEAPPVEAGQGGASIPDQEVNADLAQEESEPKLDAEPSDEAENQPALEESSPPLQTIEPIGPAVEDILAPANAETESSTPQTPPAPKPASTPVRATFPSHAQATTSTFAKYGLWSASTPNAVNRASAVQQPDAGSSAGIAPTVPGSKAAETALPETTKVAAAEGTGTRAPVDPPAQPGSHAEAGASRVPDAKTPAHLVETVVEPAATVETQRTAAAMPPSRLSAAELAELAKPNVPPHGIGKTPPASAALPFLRMLGVKSQATPEASSLKANADGKASSISPNLTARFKRWLNPATPAKTDRRRAYRRYVPSMVAHYYNGGPPKPYEVADISMTGLYLLTEDCWMPDTMIQMTLQKPCAKGERKQSVTVLAKIVRRGSDGVAVQFVMADNLDPQSRDVQPSQATDKFALARFL